MNALKMTLLVAVAALTLVACEGSTEPDTTQTTSPSEPADVTATSPTSTTLGAREGHSTVRFVDLAIGDCFNALEGHVSMTSFEVDVDLVSCTWAHEAEVFGTYSLTEEPPEYESAGEIAIRLCANEFTAYVGNPLEFSSLYAWEILPTKAAWDQGDRDVHCVLVDHNGDYLRGSAWQQGW